MCGDTSYFPHRKTRVPNDLFGCKLGTGICDLCIPSSGGSDMPLCLQKLGFCFCRNDIQWFAIWEDILFQNASPSLRKGSSCIDRLQPGLPRFLILLSLIFSNFPPFLLLSDLFFSCMINHFNHWLFLYLNPGNSCLFFQPKVFKLPWCFPFRYWQSHSQLTLILDWWNHVRLNQLQPAFSYEPFFIFCWFCLSLVFFVLFSFPIQRIDA